MRSFKVKKQNKSSLKTPSLRGPADASTNKNRMILSESDLSFNVRTLSAEVEDINSNVAEIVNDATIDRSKLNNLAESIRMFEDRVDTVETNIDSEKARLNRIDRVCR